MDKLNILIVGCGEVGDSHYELLSQAYNVWGVDIKPELNKTNTEQKDPTEVDVLLIAIRYEENFIETVKQYLEKYKPKMVDILSTTPPGTAEQLGSMVCRSTSRGTHPHLVAGLQKIPKHVGGGHAIELRSIYEQVGIPCRIHRNSRTVELLHLANNIAYGVNLILADEIQKLCREANVDYFYFMEYTRTNNEGYTLLDMPTKVRTICTPPNGHIGGHCVSMSAQMIPESIRGPMIDILAKYNER
jgi:UDP-N-acetyl-D-mannosaminuronate dehydrogenase